MARLHVLVGLVAIAVGVHFLNKGQLHSVLKDASEHPWVEEATDAVALQLNWARLQIHTWLQRDRDPTRIIHPPGDLVPDTFYGSESYPAACRLSGKVGQGRHVKHRINVLRCVCVPPSRLLAADAISQPWNE